MKWYLATNEVDVFHYGSMEEDWEITTGQPNLFFYNTKDELVAALNGYGQQYQDPIAIDATDPIELSTPEIPLPE